MKNFRIIMMLCCLALLFTVAVPVASHLLHASSTEIGWCAFMALSAGGQMITLGQAHLVGMATTANQPKVVPAFTRESALMNAFQNMPQKNKNGETTGYVSYRTTYSSLRCDVLLNSGQIPQFNFAPQTSASQIQHLLRNQDSFIPTKMGLFVRKATGTSQSDAADSSSVLQTWANPQIFTGSSEAANLYAVWNSYLTLTLGSTNLLEFVHTGEFYRVGIAQQGVAVSTVTTTGLYQQNEWDGGDYGFVRFHPDQCFNGLLAPTVMINNTGGNTLAGTSSLNYAVLIFKGILVQNGSKDVTDAVLGNFKYEDAA
jgi:hypothetical protein